MELYIYRDSGLTGTVAWKISDTPLAADVLEHTKGFAYCAVIPHYPVTIYSKMFGTIRSAFDPETTIAHGVKRLAVNDRGDPVLCIEFCGSFYNLAIDGYAPMVLTGRTLPPSRYVLRVNGEEIVRICDVPRSQAEQAGLSAGDVKLMHIEDEYLPLLEVLAAIPTLVFFPLYDEAF